MQRIWINEKSKARRLIHSILGIGITSAALTLPFGAVKPAFANEPLLENSYNQHLIKQKPVQKRLHVSRHKTHTSVASPRKKAASKSKEDKNETLLGGIIMTVILLWAVSRLSKRRKEQRKERARAAENERAKRELEEKRDLEEKRRWAQECSTEYRRYNRLSGDERTKERGRLLGHYLNSSGTAKPPYWDKLVEGELDQPLDSKRLNKIIAAYIADAAENGKNAPKVVCAKMSQTELYDYIDARIEGFKKSSESGIPQAIVANMTEEQLYRYAHAWATASPYTFSFELPISLNRLGKYRYRFLDDCLTIFEHKLKDMPNRIFNALDKRQKRCHTWDHWTLFKETSSETSLPSEILPYLNEDTQKQYERIKKKRLEKGYWEQQQEASKRSGPH